MHGIGTYEASKVFFRTFVLIFTYSSGHFGIGVLAIWLVLDVFGIDIIGFDTLLNDQGRLLVPSMYSSQSIL
jgi:hypothetical protein